MKKTINLLVVMLFLFSMAINGQTVRNITIKGIVYDNFDDPLPGVSIYIKNSPGVGTTSDVDGNFTIKAAKNEIIVFQMVGMDIVEYHADKNVD